MNTLTQTTIFGLLLASLGAGGVAPAEVVAQDTTGEVAATQDQRYLIHVKGIT